MTRAEALRGLLEDIEVGTWPGYSAFPSDLHTDLVWKSFEGSLDAAKALHEAVLPGWTWSTADDAHDERWFVVGDGAAFETEECYSGNPARAWLIAILHALLSQQDTGEAG